MLVEMIIILAHKNGSIECQTVKHTVYPKNDTNYKQIQREVNKYDLYKRNK